MLGRRVDVLVDSPPAITSHVKDGNMRVLASLAPKGAKAMPDAPTLAEPGYQDAALSPWNGAFVHSETPDGTLKQIAALFDKITASDESKATFASWAWSLGAAPAELDAGRCRRTSRSGPI